MGVYLVITLSFRTIKSIFHHTYTSNLKLNQIYSRVAKILFARGTRKNMNVQAVYMYNLSFVSTFVGEVQMCSLTSVSTSYIAEQTNSPQSHTPSLLVRLSITLETQIFGRGRGKGGESGGLGMCNLQHQFNRGQTELVGLKDRIEDRAGFSAESNGAAASTDPNPHPPCPVNIILGAEAGH